MNIVAVDGATLNPGDNPWEPLKSLGNFTVYPNSTQSETIDRCADAEVIVVNKVVLDANTLAQLPNLKFIAVTATGYNNIDVSAANAQGIQVSNIPVYSTESVAQHVFASLLSFIHQPQRHHDAILDGQWQASGNFSFWLAPITELAGKTFGIVGLGRIGRATAKLADAFGMKIVAHSRSEKNVLDFDGFEWASLERLFETSDFISLHCPQTKSNARFVNKELIAVMKSSAVLVNTARGGLIDESDLADALNTNQIGGAILDVVSSEPIHPDNPLLHAKNCLLTPHIAWCTIEARRRAMKITAENVAGFISGDPINLV